MSDYGSIETIRQILDISEGTETDKLLALKKLSNVWLDSYVHEDILSDVSSDVKNTVTEYHTVYLFRMSSERFSGDESGYAKQWKDLGKEILDREILSDAIVYKIHKENK